MFIQSNGFDVEGLYFFSGPFRFPQKGQTGINARFMRKTIDANAARKPFPAVFVN
jgi:hypothetical protein